jgi:hypothetical protein
MLSQSVVKDMDSPAGIQISVSAKAGRLGPYLLHAPARASTVGRTIEPYARDHLGVPYN